MTRSGTWWRGVAVAAGMLVALPALAQTVVTDTFDDPNTAWTNGFQGDVRVGYEAGEYWMTARSVSPIVLGSNGFAFANGTVSFEVRNAGESLAHGQGVFLRAQDPDNYYAFYITSDSTFEAFHVVAGEIVPDSPPVSVLPAGLYRTDAPNVIEAVANGAEIEFRVNGTSVFTTTGVTWPEGVTGFLFVNTYIQPAGSIFDNWRVEVAP
ncbi:MAG: hypothetical protein AB7O56_04925 [Bauldia sp.]